MTAQGLDRAGRARQRPLGRDGRSRPPARLVPGARRGDRIPPDGAAGEVPRLREPRAAARRGGREDPQPHRREQVPAGRGPGGDQGLGRAEHELADLREQRSPLGHELGRVQRLAEEQGGKISEWEGRYATLRESAESERQRLHALELQLAGEITARQRGESQHESEAGQLRAERASLAMKLEAAVSRAGSLEQAVAQLRQQLRERDDAARAGERIAKEAAIDRTTAERRAEALQSEVLRQTDRLVEAQRQQSELAARCEMLAKALAAKDVAVEQATNRAAALSDRLEQAGQTRQRELQELEQANRRLMEQLETERSERSLVQGALDIARESRLALQKQHEQLKKSIRRGQAPDEAEGAPGSPPAGGGEDSNVRPFPGPGRVN